jgi:DNA polymerase elongation subunit (family B)
MARVVIDIETLSFPFESFDEVQQEYLLKFAETEAEKEEAVQKLSLYPTTAQIIVIGMLNPDTNRAKVLFQTADGSSTDSQGEQAHFVTGSEKEILSQFWNDVTKYEQFITFNGRGFDCPFLLLRSAILGIKPTRTMMPYRFDHATHCDLLDQLTFYGAFRKFSLDFYCKSFGIESPKSHGITGLDLGRLFKEGRFQDIATYCLGDLVATAELFRRWETYLNLK